MAMASVLSRVPISVTRPMQSALGATRCFSECKGLVSGSVTCPMESIRGATLCLSVRNGRPVQNHECAADNNNMQSNTEEPEIKADQKEKEDDADEFGYVNQPAGDKSSTFREKIMKYSKKAISFVSGIFK